MVEIGMTPSLPVDRLESIDIGASGRTWALRVYFKGGTFVDLDLLQTRKLMTLFGPIRSFLYSLGSIQADGKQSIEGHGYGHGVGLSQWGAQLFAAKGWDAHKILKYYYQNTEITQL